MGRLAKSRRSAAKLQKSDAQAASIADDSSVPAPKARRSFAKWRALSLSLVYLVFAAHIIHWKLTGNTLAPLELNEVMYTLELGVITAGFLFMCCLVLGTLFFGRFFCSWACHIMVLQDLCAWLLEKLKIRRRPIRSRLLLLVPLSTAFYMFIWPQILRAIEAKAFPTFHFRDDSEGWASFVTNDFWRNLPAPPVIVLTFLVCGFALVYLLGSRTFCTYVCPYGAIFALADRFSPGRIKVDQDKCVQCATCTAACSSGIRVHEEIKQHDIIVNPACLKDLDCVAACPHEAIKYTFAKPSFFKSFASGGRFGKLPYDFSFAEEAIMAVVFVFSLLTFRGLYSRGPFLLSLASGAILAVFTVTTLRLFFRSDVRLATMQLKRQGRLTRASGFYVPLFLILAAFTLHSAFVRYHEYTGLRYAIEMNDAKDPARRAELAGPTRARLQVAERWGLIGNQRVEYGLMWAAYYLRKPDEVETYARRFLAASPTDIQARLRLGDVLYHRGRTDAGRDELRTLLSQFGDYPLKMRGELAKAYKVLVAILAQEGTLPALVEDWKVVPNESIERALMNAANHSGMFGDAEVYSSRLLERYPEDSEVLRGKARALFGMGRRSEAVATLHHARDILPDDARVHEDLGLLLAQLERFDEAVASLREAIRLDPERGETRYNLGAILGRMGRHDEAITCYREALDSLSRDASLHNNLGRSLLETGSLDEAREHLERAIEINPDYANAHLNLSHLFKSQNDAAKAEEHFDIAVRLEPRYRQLPSPGASN